MKAKQNSQSGRSANTLVLSRLKHQAAGCWESVFRRQKLVHRQPAHITAPAGHMGAAADPSR